MAPREVTCLGDCHSQEERAKVRPTRHPRLVFWSRGRLIQGIGGFHTCLEGLEGRARNWEDAQWGPTAFWVPSDFQGQVPMHHAFLPPTVKSRKQSRVWEGGASSHTVVAGVCLMMAFLRHTGERVFPGSPVSRCVAGASPDILFGIRPGGKGRDLWSPCCCLPFLPGPRGRAVGPGHTPQPGTVCDMWAG